MPLQLGIIKEPLATSLNRTNKLVEQAYLSLSMSELMLPQSRLVMEQLVAQREVALESARPQLLITTILIRTLNRL